MKHVLDFLKNKLFLFFLTLISYLMIIITVAVRYDNALILSLSIANALLCTVVLARGLSKKPIESRWFFLFAAGGLVLMFVCLTFNMTYATMFGIANFWTHLSMMLPAALIVIAALFLIFILPKVPKKPRFLLSILLVVVIFLSVLIPSLKLFGFRFTSDPLVFDNGENYVVVWATNDLSTGHVRYQTGGEEKIVWNEIEGRKQVARIHTVSVPYDDLNENRYSVHSTRIRGDYEYKLGKTVDSPTFSFRGKTGEDLNIIAASDWHGMVGALTDTASHFDRPDLFLMMGDFANDCTSEKTVVKKIIEAGAKVTGSECPAIFVRGNHEARGTAAIGLGKSLGLDRLYYTVERGPYTFVIVDSGEDKPDGHAEYHGLNVFEEYFERQMHWLESLPAPTSRYVFTLIHSESYAPVQALQDRFVEQMDRIGSHLVLSGHRHVYRITDYATIAESPKNYLHIIDGGKNSPDLYKADYIATQLTIKDGTMRILMKDEYGHIYEDRSLTIGN